MRAAVGRVYVVDESIGVLDETLVILKGDLDVDVLTQISEMTGGEYFRATDNRALESIYQEINELEKTKVETDNQTRWFELFMPYALAALILLVIELILNYFYIRRIP